MAGPGIRRWHGVQVGEVLGAGPLTFQRPFSPVTPDHRLICRASSAVRRPR